MAHYPQRFGEPVCRDFLRTGRCKYGDSCKYHHPLGGVKTADPNEPPFPIRPDEPLCQYFLKNGTCKFGQTCKFNHPAHMIGISRSQNPFPLGGTTSKSSNSNLHPPTQDIQNINELGLLLPQRPNQPHCIYYLNHGRCKYGSTCKYHHPTNAHMISANSSRHFSHSSHGSPLYQVSDRERSASCGSMLEIRESYSQGTIMRGTATHAPIDHRRVVDSVPHRSRRESLDTISNSYHPYSNQVMDGKVNYSQQRYHVNSTPDNSPQQRYHVNATPENSPKLGPLSITSSTLASSYDTAVSTIEKLPQTSTQYQNVIRRTLSGNSHHSRSNLSEGTMSFDDAAQKNSSSFDTSRISNIRHYSKGPPPARTNNHAHPYDLEGSFPHANNTMDNSRLPTGAGAYNDQSRYLRDRQENGSMIRRSVGKPITRPNAVDDGLSMMTSALLTMLDTPGNGRNENADTISTHSSNMEDNALAASSLDSPFVSRSLPEFVSSPMGHERPNQQQDQSIFRTIGPRTDLQFQYSANQSYQNGFHSQQQSRPHPPFPLHSAEYSSQSFGRNDIPVPQNYNMAQMSQNLGNMSLGAKPVVAVTQRRQWPNTVRGPNSDTVGSVPTQFFLS